MRTAFRICVLVFLLSAPRLLYGAQSQMVVSLAIENRAESGITIVADGYAPSIPIIWKPGTNTTVDVDFNGVRISYELRQFAPPLIARAPDAEHLIPSEQIIVSIF